MFENPFRHEAARRREQLDRAARHSFRRTRNRRWPRLPSLLTPLRSLVARARRLLPIRVSFGPCCEPGDRIESPTWISETYR